MTMLQVFTSTIGKWMRDVQHAIDITRKSAKPEWKFLAPSWAILRPALEARREADKLYQECTTKALLLGGYEDENGNPTFDPFVYQRDAEAILDAAWREYRPKYLDEMRASYRQNRRAWDALLARDKVILCCYWCDAEHCHRAILRTEILTKLGAKDCGEVSPATFARG